MVLAAMGVWLSVCAAAKAAGKTAQPVEQMRELVVADWVDQDRRYRPGQSLKAQPPGLGARGTAAAAQGAPRQLSRARRS